MGIQDFLMLFTTDNSTYEVEGSRIRRLEGVRGPTPRQGVDGEWKSFHAISEIAVGCSVIIVWRIVDGVAQASQTSSIRRIHARH